MHNHHCNPTYFSRSDIAISSLRMQSTFLTPHLCSQCFFHQECPLYLPVSEIHQTFQVAPMAAFPSRLCNCKGIFPSLNSGTNACLMSMEIHWRFIELVFKSTFDLASIHILLGFSTRLCSPPGQLVRIC